MKRFGKYVVLTALTLALAGGAAFAHGPGPMVGFRPAVPMAGGPHPMMGPRLIEPIRPMKPVAPIPVLRPTGVMAPMKPLQSPTVIMPMQATDVPSMLPMRPLMPPTPYRPTGIITPMLPNRSIAYGPVAPYINPRIDNPYRIPRVRPFIGGDHIHHPCLDYTPRWGIIY